MVELLADKSPQPRLMADKSSQPRVADHSDRDSYFYSFWETFFFGRDLSGSCLVLASQFNQALWVSCIILSKCNFWDVGSAKGPEGRILMLQFKTHPE